VAEREHARIGIQILPFCRRSAMRVDITALFFEREDVLPVVLHTDDHSASLLGRGQQRIREGPPTFESDPWANSCVASS
jgi:hypothetical protein